MALAFCAKLIPKTPVAAEAVQAGAGEETVEIRVEMAEMEMEETRDNKIKANLNPKPRLLPLPPPPLPKTAMVTRETAEATGEIMGVIRSRAIKIKGETMAEVISKMEMEVEPRVAMS